MFTYRPTIGGYLLTKISEDKGWSERKGYMGKFVAERNGKSPQQ